MDPRSSALHAQREISAHLARGLEEVRWIRQGEEGENLTRKSTAWTTTFTPSVKVPGQVMLTFGFFGLHFFTSSSSCRDAISNTSYKQVLLTVCIKHWLSWKIQAPHTSLSIQTCIWSSLTLLPISEREEMWPLAWLAHCIYEARSHHKEVHQAPTSLCPQQHPISAVSTAVGHAMSNTEWCRSGLKKNVLEKHLIWNWEV